MAQCYPNCELPGGGVAGPGRPQIRPQKDYSRPLHVDCSVEYELPNAAMPPAGAKTEPLLMIHPCYYRRAESQRRSPFINNLPSRAAVGSGMVSVGRRASQAARARLAPPAPHPPYPVRVVEQAAARAEAVMALLWPEGPPPLYTKPVRKRDPLLCGGDFSSGSDSGISAGHWTDSDRSPLAPELRLQRDFQAGPDSGIATPVSLAEEKTGKQQILQPPVATCSCGKQQCAVVPSYDPSNCENHYLPPSYDQTPVQVSRYSQTQLHQWLQSVQVSLSPQRRRAVPVASLAPQPPMHRQMHIVSPIVIH